MKIATVAEEVEVIGGSGRSNNFSVAMNAKMFDILSGSIYQNKIAAVVRELSCNAYDAHVAAGKQQVPIKIHLPTLLGPYFSVSDEGIGLSVDDVMQLYTTYGESRKDKSDDFIGGFGLGSKSPFAYTDHFTVTSVFAGQTSTFAAYRNEEGFPKIDLINSEDTPDQPNGLKVQLAVQASDFASFKKEAEALFTYWDVVPEGITVPPRNEWKSIFKSADGAEMLLIKQLKRSWERDVDKVQVGLVTYATDFSSRYALVSPVAKRWLMSNYFLIKMPIGSVDIAVSRETLSETPRTKKYFEAFFQEFASQLEETVKAGIESSSSVQQFYAGVGQAEHDKLKVYPLTYNNITFNTRKEVDDYLKQNYSLFANSRDGSKNQQIVAHTFSRSWRADKQPYSSNNAVTWNNLFHALISDEWQRDRKKQIAVIDDLQNEKFKYRKHRIDAILDQNPVSQTRLFWFSDQAQYDTFVAAVDAWMGTPFFSDAPLSLLSVPPPNQVNAVPQPKNVLSEFWKIVKPLSFSRGSKHYYLDSWVHATENASALLSDIETTLEGYYLIGTSRAVETDEYTGMVREGLSIALQEKKPVYMFTNRQLGRVQKNPKLKHLSSIIPELYAKCSEDELWQIQLKYEGRDAFPSEDVLKLLTADADGAALYPRVKLEPTLTPKYSETLWDFYGVEIENKFKQRIDDIKQEYARVLAKYPLLGSMRKEFLPKYIELQKFYNDHHP